MPLTSHEAKRLDTQIDDDNNNHTWNIIATELDNKPCITLWRAMQTSESNNIARNNTFTKIEIKLKTGRYHQIRRHMSWVIKCPIVGDNTYEVSSMHHISGYGLLLCANRIKFIHPMNKLSEKIDISIPLPKKFKTLMNEHAKI